MTKHILLGFFMFSILACSKDKNAIDTPINTTSDISQKTVINKTRWLVFRIKEFKNIETSGDNTFSIIKGITISGKEFKIKATWEDLKSCPNFIESWINDPKPDHGPYILSGSAIGEDPIVLRVDTCTPRGKNFKAPPENEY